MPVVGPHRCKLCSFHGVPQVQLLDKVVVPVVCMTNALIQIVAPCRKLWKIRRFSSSTRSASSPSVRRDRFPWSHCSADHGDSPVAVH